MRHFTPALLIVSTLAIPVASAQVPVQPNPLELHYRAQQQTWPAPLPYVPVPDVPVPNLPTAHDLSHHLGHSSSMRPFDRAPEILVSGRPRFAPPKHLGELPPLPLSPPQPPFEREESESPWWSHLVPDAIQHLFFGDGVAEPKPGAAAVKAEATSLATVGGLADDGVRAGVARSAVAQSVAGSTAAKGLFGGALRKLLTMVVVGCGALFVWRRNGS